MICFIYFYQQSFSLPCNFVFIESLRMESTFKIIEWGGHSLLAECSLGKGHQNYSHAQSNSMDFCREANTVKSLSFCGGKKLRSDSTSGIRAIQTRTRSKSCPLFCQYGQQEHAFCPMWHRRTGWRELVFVLKALEIRDFQSICSKKL